MQIWFKSTAGRVETVAIFCEPSPWTGFETNSKIPASCQRKYWPTLMISLVGDFITVGNNSVFIFTNKFHDFQMWALAFFLLRYCCSRFSKSFVTTLYSAIFWPITSILRYGRFLTTLMNLFVFLRPLSYLAMCVCGGGGGGYQLLTPDAALLWTALIRTIFLFRCSVLLLFCAIGLSFMITRFLRESREQSANAHLW